MEMGMGIKEITLFIVNIILFLLGLCLAFKMYRDSRFKQKGIYLDAVVTKEIDINVWHYHGTDYSHVPVGEKVKVIQLIENTNYLYPSVIISFKGLLIVTGINNIKLV